MTDEALPPPPIPAEVDLTDFNFMPLEVRRLRDSRLAASVDGEAFRATVLLWCAAWHQLPAGSLPNDDIELAQLAGYGRVISEWQKVKEGALYGWDLCSDGRLYHTVVVEKALDAWMSKIADRYKRDTERMRKDNYRRKEDKLEPYPLPNLEQWNEFRLSQGVAPDRFKFPADKWVCPAGQQPMSQGQTGNSHGTAQGNPPENASKGEVRDSKGTGRGKGQGEVTKSSRTEEARPLEGGKDQKPAEGEKRGASQADAIAAFERIQAAYPKFAGRQDWITAQNACNQLVEAKLPTGETWASLLAGVERYAKHIRAKGDEGTQFVLRPGVFFTAADRPWLQQWEIPAARPKKSTPEQATVKHEDREREQLQKLKDRRASIGLADFRDPHLGESASDYRRAQDDEWETRRTPSARVDRAVDHDDCSSDDARDELACSNEPQQLDRRSELNSLAASALKVMP